MRFRPLPPEKLKRVLTIEEHAELVLELLKEQKYTTSVSEDDLCPIKNEVILMKLRDTIREMQLKRTDSTYTPISIGAHVSTRSMDICPMGPRKRSRGVRKEMHGNVIKPSDYFPGYWLVHFFSEEVNEYYYCCTRMLKYHCSATVTSQVGPGLFDNNIAAVPIQVPPHDNEEAIMLCLLNDKIHRCEGYKNISINEIVGMFQPKFSWITQTKLNSFIQKFRKSMIKKASKAKKKNQSKKSPNSVTTPSLSSSASPNTTPGSNDRDKGSQPGEYIYISLCCTLNNNLFSSILFLTSHIHHDNNSIWN